MSSENGDKMIEKPAEPQFEGILSNHRFPQSLVRAFFKRLIKTDSCWGMSGYKKSNGYCGFNAFGRTSSGHRFSYEIHKGPIPPGLTIDHLCRNRGCVNPDHLEAVTQAENLRRAPLAISQINKSKTHCPRGHEYVGTNVYILADGSRTCRICKNSYRRAYYARKEKSTRNRVSLHGEGA